ncbi:MAG: multidrug ABC transporter ATP-binding protein [Gemmatimonas sp. SG8_23]|jgi:ABC-2 type transport system ATP-binding protein|nr:MAG: multidrug ABC transporter ATP-binding protein [Gemmatimonas sp. SG8_23]
MTAPGMRDSGTYPVEVDGLTRRFGDFTAVDAVTFRVHPGEIFGFLGPNGAGKTTTIKMLTGLLEPSEGTGRVAGLDVRTERTAIRERIGYMSQKFSLYADLTVRENIELFAGLYGVVGTRYDERKAWVLRMSELHDQQGLVTGDLPLGWKQRLALGCATLHEPPILFLDEPTSGVDPIARRRFWDLIAEMSAAGTTVFVSTHYMEEAEYCHRLALLNRGRLIALDTPRALRARTVDPIYRVRTIDAPRAVQALVDASGIVEAAMYGRDVHVTVAEEATGPVAIRAALATEGVPVSGIEPVEPSLEDVFTSLVRAEGGAVIG